MRLVLAHILWAAIGCSAAGAPAQPKTEVQIVESYMFEQEEAWDRLLQIPDGEFLDLDEERLGALQSGIGDLMLDAEPDDPAQTPPILTMYGPRVVDLPGSQGIPAFIAKWYAGLRAWQVNEISNLHVIVKHAATGELTFSSPRYNPRRGRRPIPSGGGDPPDSWQAGATYSSVMPINLASQLSAPIAPGLVTATTIEYDLRSRTIRVQVDGPPVDPPPAPVGYVTHELDTSDDLSLDVDVPQSVARSDPAIVRVATQVGPEASVLKNANGEPVLVAHLVLIRLDSRPLIIPAPVPVQPVTGDRDRWNAKFSVDLRATDEPLEPGTWHVFIDAGADLLGPFPMEITE
jgi:hypothetical protein